MTVLKQLNPQFFSLPNDAVTPAFRYRSYRKPLLRELQSKRKIRVDRNESFRAIKNINKTMLNNYIDRDFSYALPWKTFMKLSKIIISYGLIYIKRLI